MLKYRFPAILIQKRVSLPQSIVLIQRSLKQLPVSLTHLML